MPAGRLRTGYLALKRRAGPFWRLAVAFAVFAVIFVLGVAGFMLVEGWTFFESLYMVVITLSTVGFQEIRPLSPAGRVLTMCLILGGVGNFFFMLGLFSQLIAEGRLLKLWGKRRVQKAIAKLKDHFIVCGHGRIGAIVTREILSEGHQVVVVEHNPETIQRVEEEGLLCIHGDATKDEVLQAANIGRARSLIAALAEEAANVYVTLTARQMNPGLHIIARADEESHVARLKLAGADRVVMPTLIGGIRMAQSVLRPTVINFLDLALRGDVDLQMEELKIGAASRLAGAALAASGIRQDYDLIVIAIHKPGGEMVFNPGPALVLAADDTLLAVGKKSDLTRIKDIL
jgi:voltage-gated potassium channel